MNGRSLQQFDKGGRAPWVCFLALSPLLVSLLIGSFASAEAPLRRELRYKRPMEGSAKSFIYATNRDGSVFVGHYRSGRKVRAFRWKDGEMILLGMLEGNAHSSRAFAVSEDGSVVVGDVESKEGPQAFRWEDGKMSPVGDLPGGRVYSVARGISSDGQVIVGFAITTAGTEKFRWKDWKMMSLGEITDIGAYSTLLRTNDDGSIVVGQGDAAKSTGSFRWPPPGEAKRDEPFGFGISGDGKVEFGLAPGPTGVLEAYFRKDGVLTPIGGPAASRGSQPEASREAKPADGDRSDRVEREEKTPSKQANATSPTGPTDGTAGVLRSVYANTRIF